MNRVTLPNGSDTAFQMVWEQGETLVDMTGYDQAFLGVKRTADATDTDHVILLSTVAGPVNGCTIEIVPASSKVVATFSRQQAATMSGLYYADLILDSSTLTKARKRFPVFEIFVPLHVTNNPA